MCISVENHFLVLGIHSSLYLLSYDKLIQSKTGVYELSFHFIFAPMKVVKPLNTAQITHLKGIQFYFILNLDH